MKKNLLYSLMLSAVVGMTGCSDFLSENPVDQMPEEEAYKDPQMIYLNTVANLYTKIGADYGGGGLAGTDRGIYDLNTFTSDEAILPTRAGDWDDGGLWRELFQHKWSTNNGLLISSWDYLYGVIVLCNQAIDKLAELKENDPENVYFDVYTAEVRAIRAMYYYYLMDMFARVPVVISSKTQIKDVEQKERSEVFQFVKSELEASLPLLADKKSADEGEYYGRMTKATAYFLLAKIALNAEVYADDDWTDQKRVSGKDVKFNIEGNEVNAWDACVYYCDKVKECGYSLNHGADGFLLNFAVNNENSKENIFVIPMDPALYKARNMYLVRSRHYAVGKAYGFNNGGWNGSSATIEAMKAFGYGTPEADPRIDLTYYTGKVEGPDGSYIINPDTDTELEYLPMAVKLQFTGDEPEMKMAGARMYKYEPDMTATEDGQCPHNDWVLFRYADVLLMKAEALVRNGKDGQAPFDEVRNRVGAAHAEATLENILRERLLELAWEGWRRQDLVRFGQYNKAITDRKASESYRQVFPIHESTLNVNGNLSQNYGY